MEPLGINFPGPPADADPAARAQAPAPNNARRLHHRRYVNLAAQILDLCESSGFPLETCIAAAGAARADMEYQRRVNSGRW